MLLKLRKNAQITLPAQIRKSAHLEEGDLLDCEVREGHIVLTPKKLINKSDAWFWSKQWQKAEAEAQKNIQTGDLQEFDTVDDLLKHLKGE
ncbi:MAG: AbrB/MazE/SpoVT family DNA-binding domain-containing protein [Armatimonadota bacterium]|nr:AbrB/MazE/SpoVT family DNA-binding domain-containing protein [Armatimonadota bacterium]